MGSDTAERVTGPQCPRCGPGGDSLCTANDWDERDAYSDDELEEALCAMDWGDSPDVRALRATFARLRGQARHYGFER